MYPPVSNIPEVVDWRLIGIRKASQDQHANSSLPYCKYMGIVLLELPEKIVSKSPIDLQNM